MKLIVCWLWFSRISIYTQFSSLNRKTKPMKLDDWADVGKWMTSWCYAEILLKRVNGEQRTQAQAHVQVWTVYGCKCQKRLCYLDSTRTSNLRSSLNRTNKKRLGEERRNKKGYVDGLSVMPSHLLSLFPFIAVSFFLLEEILEWLFLKSLLRPNQNRIVDDVSVTHRA